MGRERGSKKERKKNLKWRLFFILNHFRINLKAFHLDKDRRAEGSEY